MSDTPPVRIANFSGFYGDRDSAMREMLDGGDVDYLTGDYLAELTMLILAKGMMKDPTLGYAKRFIDHLDTCLDSIAKRGVKVVTNAGGLNPPASPTPSGKRSPSVAWTSPWPMSTATTSENHYARLFLTPSAPMPISAPSASSNV